MNLNGPLGSPHIPRCARFAATAGLIAIALAGCSNSQPAHVSPAETITDHTSVATPVDTTSRTEAPAQPQATTGSLVGNWEPSDGSELKVLNADGRCQGFYYDPSTDKPLDIGGPSACYLSSTQDEAGRYQLKVIQGPNRATYLVEFHGDDAATVYTESGTELYRLSRF